MKWFKHMTNMRNDLFVKKIRKEFGLEGYAIYNLILEIYAEACGKDPGSEVEFDKGILLDELGVKEPKMMRVVDACVAAGKWVAPTSDSVDGRKNKTILLAIPKMASIKDDYSRKSGQGTDKVRHKKEEAEELTNVNSEEEADPPNLHPSVSDDAKPSGRKLGHRIPDGWQPKVETLEWSKQKRPDLEISEVLEEFRDYWASASGAYARKVDWDLTFKNRIRAYPLKLVSPKQQNGLALGRPSIAPHTERKGGLLEL